MQCHEVALGQQPLEAVDPVHMRGQLGCVLFLDPGVITEHAHPQVDGRVRHPVTDRAKPDDAQCPAADLEPGELLLATLDGLLHVLLRQRLRIGQCRRQVPGSQQHAGHHEFLDRVGVGARSVEHDHAALGHRVDRNVVHARAGPADR